VIKLGSKQHGYTYKTLVSEFRNLKSINKLAKIMGANPSRLRPYLEKHFELDNYFQKKYPNSTTVKKRLQKIQHKKNNN
jgi:hypothetical protein